MATATQTNPHHWTHKRPDGTCPSCGRKAGCNCNAAYGAWEEAQADARDCEEAAQEVQQEAQRAREEELWWLEWDQKFDKANMLDEWLRLTGRAR